MRIISCLIVLGLLVIASPVFAEDVFDGSKTLLCASIEALDCDPGVPCDRGIAEIMGAPRFARIDFNKNEIVGPNKSTKILLINKDDDQIVLQGYEIGLGWTMAIDRVTGNIRTTFAGMNSTFMIFGACTSLP